MAFSGTSAADLPFLVKKVTPLMDIMLQIGLFWIGD
jgi:hypothetical protein